MMRKNIVVVGGSRGIGREVAKQFAANSENNVWVLSRYSKNEESVFSPYNNIFPRKIDLTSANIAQEVSEIAQEIGTIDILINNAGFLVNKPFSELTHGDILQSYQTNIIGIMLLTQQFIPFASENQMHIVNISSMGGFQGTAKFPGLSAYSSSKAALVNFTELFAEEYKNTNLKMNCLALGAVQTEMLEEAFPGYVAPTSPHEIANYIVDFALTGWKYFNGKILPVSISTP